MLTMKNTKDLVSFIRFTTPNAPLIIVFVLHSRVAEGVISSSTTSYYIKLHIQSTLRASLLRTSFT